jgi:hypothetical protein
MMSLPLTFYRATGRLSAAPQSSHSRSFSFRGVYSRVM